MDSQLAVGMQVEARMATQARQFAAEVSQVRRERPALRYSEALAVAELPVRVAVWPVSFLTQSGCTHSAQTTSEQDPVPVLRSGASKLSSLPSARVYPRSVQEFRQDVPEKNLPDRAG